MARGLARFEKIAEELVEGTFDRLGGRRLEPVTIARRLVRAMEDEQTISAGKVFVPNVYRIGLNTTTFQDFVSFKEPLQGELAAYLIEEAEKRGFHFVGRPHVTLQPDPGVAAGRLVIHTALAGGSPLDADELQITQALRADEIEGAAAQRQAAAREPLTLATNERVIALDNPPVSVGRSLDNDVILQQPSVSRHHAQVIFRHGRWLLRDLGSTHGSWVNGHRLGAGQDCILRAGDVVSLGDAVLEVRRPSTGLVRRAGRSGSEAPPDDSEP
jgi:hypothetical protein